MLWSSPAGSTDLPEDTNLSILLHNHPASLPCMYVAYTTYNWSTHLLRTQHYVVDNHQCRGKKAAQENSAGYAMAGEVVVRHKHEKKNSWFQLPLFCSLLVASIPLTFYPGRQAFLTTCVSDS